MTKVAEMWAKVAAMDMDEIVIRERDEESFLNRNNYDSNLSRTKDASRQAIERADNMLALAGAYYARDFLKIGGQDEEIKYLESRLSPDVTSMSVELAAWWTN